MTILFRIHPPLTPVNAKFCNSHFHCYFLLINPLIKMSRKSRLSHSFIHSFAKATHHRQKLPSKQQMGRDPPLFPIPCHTQADAARRTNIQTHSMFEQNKHRSIRIISKHPPKAHFIGVKKRFGRLSISLCPGMASTAKIGSQTRRVPMLQNRLRNAHNVPIRC